MGQKNHIAYAQAKGAPAGFVLPFPVTKEALANYVYEDLDDQISLNLPVHPLASVLRVKAIGGPVFVKFNGEANASSATHGISTLTLAVNPVDLDDDTVTIGEDDDERNYVFKSEITRKAVQVLTLDGDITPGVHALSVATLDGDIEAGDEVVIGDRTYVFAAEPSAEFEVALGVDDEASLASLLDVINNGNALTTADPLVVATASDATTITVQARVPGTDANTAPTTATGDITWADTTLGGGTGASVEGVDGDEVVIGDRTYTFVDELSEDEAEAIEDQVLWETSDAVALDNLKSAINATAGAGTAYSTGTVIHADVTATTNTDTAQTVEAKNAGDAGNEIAVSTTGSDLSWGDDNLLGGYDDDGNTVVIGNDAEASQVNLRHAINGTGTPGTHYSAGMEKNALVWMDVWATNDAEVKSRVVGEDGNGIATTSVFDSGSNGFDVVATEGGANAGSFDSVVPAGELQEFGIDEDVTSFSLISDQASGTDVVVVEY